MVSIDGSSLHLQWELSHTPDADERFSVKFTIQSSNNTVTVKLVDLNCDLTCDRDQRVSYKLTDVETNSNYLAEVTVINLYGQSTKLYLFDPQDIISKAIGGVQYPDNCAVIAIPVVIIILLLLLGYVIILVIFVVWYLRYYRTKQATLKHRILSKPDRQYVEMSPRDTTTDGYYNLTNESCDNPQFYAESNIAPVEAVAEPTYAHIDEDGKVYEVVKTDRDYEVMKSDDSAEVAYTNVSSFLYNLSVYLSLFSSLSLAFVGTQLTVVCSRYLEVMLLLSVYN